MKTSQDRVYVALVLTSFLQGLLILIKEVLNPFTGGGLFRGGLYHLFPNQRCSTVIVHLQYQHFVKSNDAAATMPALEK